MNELEVEAAWCSSWSRLMVVIVGGENVVVGVWMAIMVAVVIDCAWWSSIPDFIGHFLRYGHSRVYLCITK